MPFYAEGHELVLAISDFFVKKDSVCYELGCSTGALTRRLAQRHRPSVRWVGIDVEANMIDQAQQYLVQKTPDVRNVDSVWWTTSSPTTTSLVTSWWPITPYSSSRRGCAKSCSGMSMTRSIGVVPSYTGFWLFAKLRKFARLLRTYRIRRRCFRLEARWFR